MWMGYLFLQTIFVAQYLIKYPIVYFFYSLSTWKNISVIRYFVKLHIITKLTGKQFYCGTNFLNKLEKRILKKKGPIKGIS